MSAANNCNYFSITFQKRLLLDMALKKVHISHPFRISQIGTCRAPNSKRNVPIFLASVKCCLSIKNLQLQVTFLGQYGKHFQLYGLQIRFFLQQPVVCFVHLYKHFLHFQIYKLIFFNI